MTEKVFEVNPVAGTVRIAGFDDSPPQGTFKLQEFKQLCFVNGWEGTLAKVEAIEAAFEETVLSICYGPRWKELMAEGNRKRRISKALFKKYYPKNWQDYWMPAGRKTRRRHRKKA